MKRKDKKQRSKRKSQSSARGSDRNPARSSGWQVNRRDFLTLARNWGVVAIVVAGIGWYMVDEVTAMFAEHDLSRIGNGTPAIVQIHDPQCPLCRALQRETRKALRTIDDDELQYLVANIRTDVGRNFATSQGVGHVTLVLLDGQGRRRSIVRGNRDSDLLATIFRAHLKVSGNK